MMVFLWFQHVINTQWFFLDVLKPYNQNLFVATVPANPRARGKNRNTDSAQYLVMLCYDMLTYGICILCNVIFCAVLIFNF